MVSIKAKPVGLSGGAKSFVWSIYHPTSGQWVEIEARTGQVVNRSPETLGLELSSVAGALVEWCKLDREHFKSANWRKIQTLVRGSR